MAYIIKNKKLFVVLVLVLIAEAILTGILPLSSGLLFGYLNTKNPLIWYGVAAYFFNYVVIDMVQAIKPFVEAKVALLHRTDRTHRVINNKGATGVTNRSQRVQEDIKLSYFNRITVYSEYFVSALILVQLLCMNLDYPILILLALLYAGISIFIAVKFNPKLTNAEKTVQSTEADFRTYLSQSALRGANDATIKAARVRSEYFLFTKVQSGVMQILPFIILIPMYMSGIIDLGTVMKHQATFALIVLNAAVLIQYYAVYIAGNASEQRVKELEGL